MMQLAGDLRDTIWKQIEDQADPQALAQWRDTLAQVTDPQQRAALEDVSIQLAGAWADSALWLGWQMAKDPAAWIFAPAADTPEE